MECAWCECWGNLGTGRFVKAGQVDTTPGEGIPRMAFKCNVCLKGPAMAERQVEERHEGRVEVYFGFR